MHQEQVGRSALSRPRWWPGSLVLLACWLAQPTLLPGQAVTGNLQGTVVALSGDPAVGVSVQAESAHLQGVREAITDWKGFFQILALPPGDYAVRFERMGIRTTVMEDVPVTLGGTTNLGDVSLETEPVALEELVVRAPRITLDPVRTDVGATLQAVDYEMLPGERDYRSILSVLPHINQSHRGDVAGVAGQSGPESSYFIDGMNATSPVWGGGDATQLPYNFIRSVEVKAGGYEAQYGHALGAVVNAVTYSGTNETDFDVFGFLTNSGLAAKSRGLPDLKTRDFWSYDLGARMSGPILRDRVWYSLAYNPRIEHSEREIEGFGFYEDRKTAHLLAGKFTWSATQPLSLELSILGDPTSHDQVGVTHWIQRTLECGDPDSYLSRWETGGITGTLRATAVLGPRWVLEGALGASDSRDRITPGTDTTEEFFLDRTTGTFSGGMFAWTTYDMRRFSARLKATGNLGSHTVVGGVEYEDASIDHDLGLSVVQRWYPTLYSYWTEGTSGGTTGSRIPVAYVQDSWRFSERLTLNAGLRWSSQFLMGQTGEVAQRFTHQWQPRLGFVFQPGRLGTQRLFGSYGRFYQAQPGYLGTFFYKDYWVSILSCASDPREAGANCETVTEELTEPDTYANLPGDLEMDHLDEFTLGYELDLGGLARVGARGIHRWLRSSFQWGWDYDPETATAQGVLGSPGKGDFDFLPPAKREYTALELWANGHLKGVDYRASYVLSRNWGNYAGYFGGDHGNLSPGGNATFMTPQQAENSEGLLPTDRTHVLKLSGSYTTSLDLSVGTFLTWQSGSPLNEFGAAGPSNRGNLGWVSFLVPRGTAGRSPDLWNLDLRLAYDAPCPGTRKCRLILDALHVGNPQRAAWLDELHFSDMDEEGNQIEENTNYLRPVAYQPPMMLRLGFEIGR